MRRLKGFSLLEILVAFAVMAVALTIVLRIFGTGVNNAVISEEYNLGVQIAESLMARTGVESPLVVGEASGLEAGKYEWRVIVKLLAQTATANDLNAANNLNALNVPNVPSAAGNQPNQDNSVISLYSVTVQVSWMDDSGGVRGIDLRSLRTL